jgi:hypothetical protein
LKLYSTSLVISFISILFLACNNQEPKVKESSLALTNVTENKVIDTNSEYSFKVYKNINSNGFGYDIYYLNKVQFHQTNIPAIPGNNGFATEKQAAQIAQLMIWKLTQQIMPPTIFIKELDSLKIQY